MYLFHVDPPTHHKNKENEEDKGCKVDRSNNWMSLLNFWEVKVSQNNTELSKSTQTNKNILSNNRKQHFSQMFLRLSATF